MSVTKRFVILAAVGVVLLMAAAPAPSPVSALIFWLYNMILFGLMVVDFILSPKASGFDVRRLGADVKLSHRAVNKISFSIYNPSHYLLSVEAQDTITDRHFSVSSPDLQQNIAPGSERLFSYHITPSKRGAYTFSQIHLKMRGLLGLVVKYHSYDCPMEFKVYPNLQDLRKFRIIMQKNRLLSRGERPIQIRGSGTEFESLRPYVDGDDYRKINWVVSARETTAQEIRLIVNDFQIEKNQPIFMMIDSGRSMSYSVGGYKKLDYAINAALVLSDIVNQKGDQSGLLVFDKEVRGLIEPGKGQNHRNNLMESLYHIQESRSTSNYSAAFRLLYQRQKRRSIVFIFTDFETPEEAAELTAHMTYLKRRHFPIVVFMKNEKLISLTDHDDEYVQEVARSFLDERDQLFRNLNAMSIPNIETEAENFSLTAVNQYLSLRR